MLKHAIKAAAFTTTLAVGIIMLPGMAESQEITVEWDEDMRSVLNKLDDLSSNLERVSNALDRFEESESRFRSRLYDDLLNFHFLEVPGERTDVNSRGFFCWKYQNAVMSISDRAPYLICAWSIDE